ncbi:MAG: hypothetical protein ABI944_06700, partial [Chthoniobacterales bacterium]
CTLRAKSDDGMRLRAAHISIQAASIKKNPLSMIVPEIFDRIRITAHASPIAGTLVLSTA